MTSDVRRQREAIASAPLRKLGAQLRNERIKAGLSQEELGRRAGVSRRLLGEIENGHRGGVEVSAIAALATVLNCRLTIVPRKAPPPSAAAGMDLISRLHGATAQKASP